MLKKILLGALLLGALGSRNAVWAGEMPAAAMDTMGMENSGLRAAIFQSPQSPRPPQAPASVQASSSCNTFKWDRACAGNSEQQCQTSCGSCTMCLDVIQFYPCVYECSCAC
jgi:hypothetical protein